MQVLPPLPLCLREVAVEGLSSSSASTIPSRRSSDSRAVEARSDNRESTATVSFSANALALLGGEVAVAGLARGLLEAGLPGAQCRPERAGASLNAARIGFSLATLMSDAAGIVRAATIGP